MWKSLLLTIVAVPLSVLVGLIAGFSVSLNAGVIACCTTMAACMIIATTMLLFLKRFSLVDVFLPLLFSIVWSAMMAIFTLGANAFSAPAAIGSGFILTLCLWRVYHAEGAGRGWLILPIIVFMYEMLPVNIPGPFDDTFAFGGDVINAIIFQFAAPTRKELPS